MPKNVRDDEALESLARYLRTARTIDDCATRYAVTHRTIYRWLDYLEDRGVEIGSRKGLFFVLT